MTGAFRSADPHGKTADLVNWAFARYGEAWVKSWFSRKTCRFSDDTVYTTSLGKTRLEQTCEPFLRPKRADGESWAEYDKRIASECVKIVVCSDVTAAFYREVDAAKGVEDKHGKKRSP